MRYFIFAFLFFIFSCSQKQEEKSNVNSKPKVQTKAKSASYFKLVSPKTRATFVVSDIIIFEISKNDTVEIDSVKLTIDQAKKISFDTKSYQYEWNSSNSRVGNIPYTIELYYKNKHQYLTGQITLLSDIEPLKKTYKVIKSYPHDKHAYTQGLKYDNGFLYEGTGQYNQSSLRKVKLETGELIQSFTLPNDVFGEGITFYKDKIIQLTWKSWIGYVYDRKEFKLLYKFTYPVPIEGWGVEFNGKHLIVSDGTSNLMFFDPESFTEVYRIQVFDHVGEVDSLNELEYIDGFLYANRYMTNMILKIDPVSGKVLEEINLSGLLKAEDYHANIDVLNGIAFDKENKRFFVTGKYWPKLFHIEIN